MPEYYTTSDGNTTIIDKGGEQIVNNTYGFEVEFCTHDNPVFAFTHVDVARIQITLPNLDPEKRQRSWKIETDSGNVLELVTDPTHFPTTVDAYAAKNLLVDFLVQSVTLHGVPPETIDAMTFFQWATTAVPGLILITKAWYSGDGTTTVAINKEDWDDIGKQLTLENVDDGINIKAARKRYQMNQGTWPQYVDSTIVCRSEKDWGASYSSQVNMPMTLQGYFLYVVKKKLPKADSRVSQILALNSVEDRSDSKIEQQVTNWFWMNVITAVCNTYISRLYGGNPDIRNVDVTKLTLQQLKKISFIYVATHKILTGALGALSEPNQLILQELAWTEQSTEAMIANSPYSYQQLISSRGIKTVKWLEYHSSMKDLTGLWFKAALEAVMCNETLLYQNSKKELDLSFYHGLSKVIGEDEGAIWKAALKHYLKDIRNEKWDPLLDSRDVSVYDLENLDYRVLAASIAGVEAALANKLSHIDPGGGFVLPPRSARKFLHYKEAPAWEGRYDTMVQAFPRDDIGWTYLVEHRFN
jgi:hypothetical protein